MKPYEFYYLDAQGLQQGPVPFSSLAQLGLNHNTMVWYDGIPGDQWTIVANLPEFAAAIRRPGTPPPPRQTPFADDSTAYVPSGGDTETISFDDSRAHFDDGYTHLRFDNPALKPKHKRNGLVDPSLKLDDSHQQANKMILTFGGALFVVMGILGLFLSNMLASAFDTKPMIFAIVIGALIIIASVVLALIHKDKFLTIRLIIAGVLVAAAYSVPTLIRFEDGCDYKDGIGLYSSRMYNNFGKELIDFGYSPQQFVRRATGDAAVVVIKYEKEKDEDKVFEVSIKAYDNTGDKVFSDKGMVYAEQGYITPFDGNDAWKKIKEVLEEEDIEIEDY